MSISPLLAYLIVDNGDYKKLKDFLEKAENFATGDVTTLEMISKVMKGGSTAKQQVVKGSIPTPPQDRQPIGSRRAIPAPSGKPVIAAEETQLKAAADAKAAAEAEAKAAAKLKAAGGEAADALEEEGGESAAAKAAAEADAKLKAGGKEGEETGGKKPEQEKLLQDISEKLTAEEVMELFVLILKMISNKNS